MNEHTSPAFWPARGSLHEGRAFVLKEDVIFTVLAQEGGISWMNGRHPQSGGSFIIATAVSDEEEERATRLLKNEFALRDRLHDGWAIRPVASTQYRGRFALVYAPFCFELLACRAGKAISGIARFIEMAIRICGPLRQMHLHNLIHGDIKPGAFFVHHDATCRLCSFGLSCGTSDAFSQSRLAASGGTPAYMSPEHTTRTRRAVDSRSDLYSLGIVLYELLTGRLPFELSADDQTNWAHYHIASEPLAPGRVRPDVPGMLSTIILKLLEKNPENRYQTVDGLIADLRRCQATLTAEGEIVDFIPGQQDRSPAIHLADSLFSAHPQASDVIAAFERVSQSGAPELVTIGGPSGIGKSSVIATTLKSLQQRKVLLAVGKVDQYSPTLPYGVLSSAFRTLTLHLLGLPAGEVATWKIRLSRALEGFEELAVSLVPELNLLLENKPRFSADTFSIDARARFSHMVLALVKTFATQGAPLVLLLDNVQWIDAASLQTLDHLLRACGAIPLLVVVAHRDLSSLSEPTLQTALASLPEAAQHATTIVPQPLSVKAVARWLGGIFHTRSTGTADLATLIHEKTGGNPLFVQEFFRRIVDDGLVVHNKYQGKWHYDLQAIRARHYTENVVTLVLEQLKEMPDETRRLLGSIACLGCTGELEMLCRVVGRSAAEIRYALHPAVTAQLIVLTEKEYAFTHDRVQEAAFALLDEGEKSHLHLTTASLLADAARQTAGNELLFRAVHHVSAALDCIQPAPQRQRFRELSLQAARRAKRTGDYLSALSYIQTARALGNAGPVSDFMLDIEEAGCEFALGHLERTRALCDAILGSPGGLTEKALAANLLAEVYMRQSEIRLALEASLCWLGVFGIQISRYPENAECDEAWQQFCQRTADAPQNPFSQLKLMENAETEAVMNLLYSASIFASFTCPRLHFLLLCRMMHLTLDHGITGASTTAMAWFGVLMGHRYAEYRLGFQYGTLARELAGRFSLACGYPTASDAHFRGAIAAWGRVGAQAKVRQLEQDFPHLLASGQSRAYDTAAFAQNEVIRDLQSVIKASRALSEEINLERLIENLMTLLLERAGAQRGLLLRVSDNHIPEIEASAWTSTDGVRVRILKASPMATDMPLSVLAAVIRTGQEIRTGKPEEFHPFSQDPYLVTSGAAVMCVPMFKQARLVGILYLENRLMPEVFTAEHSRVVSLLGAQAAVSLETARLYAELLAENIQRRRVEKELRASQTSLMLGEQISHTGSWRWELVQDLMFMSEEYARILGLPEQQKMISMAEFLTFVHEDDYGRISTLVNQSVRDGLSMRAEFRIIRTDGSVRYILGIGDPVGVGSEVNEYYGIITDITSQRAAEDAMRVAQADLARVSRATTVGQLTSSIAHEINQPLMSIVSNAGASLRWLNRDPARLEKVREGLEEIAAEGERAGEIIRSIQSLTRKQDPTFTRIDLHFLIHHIIMLSRSELELRHISVDYLLNADDSFIIGDSVQIQQVLLNLVMNAMEAMAEVTDRPCSITIATANCAEGKVIFEIADTGSGIEPELTERIFDSFYSTKAQGMGMGLTISASIIERHRGKLSARRREPYGTVFTFALPLAGQEM